MLQVMQLTLEVFNKKLQLQLAILYCLKDSKEGYNGQLASQLVYIIILDCPCTGYSKLTQSFFKLRPSDLDAVFYWKGCIFLHRFGFPTSQLALLIWASNQLYNACHNSLWLYAPVVTRGQAFIQLVASQCQSAGICTCMFRSVAIQLASYLDTETHQLCSSYRIVLLSIFTMQLGSRGHIPTWKAQPIGESITIGTQKQIA